MWYSMGSPILHDCDYVRLEMMSEKPFKPGDVLIDALIAQSAAAVLSRGISNSVQPLIAEIERPMIYSLMQLVETIVIHNRLVIGSPPYEPELDIGQGFEKIRVLLSFPEDTMKLINELIGAEKPAEDDPYREMIRLLNTIDPGIYERYYSNYNETVSFHAMTQMAAAQYGLAYRAITGAKQTSKYASVAEKTLNKIEDVINQDNKIADEYVGDYFKLDVPIIFNYIMEKARNRKDIIPVALEVREMKVARAFRNQLTLLDEAAAVGEGKIVKEMVREIDDRVKALGKKLGQPSIDLYVGAPLSISQNIGQIAKWIQAAITHHRKRHLIFIEKMFDWNRQPRSIRRQMSKLLR
jgi:hypothetical protein